MSANIPDDATRNSPEWCLNHERWFNMCHWSIGENNPNYRDEFNVCIKLHDEKILARHKAQVEAIVKVDRERLADAVYDADLRHCDPLLLTSIVVDLIESAPIDINEGESK